MLLSVDTGLGLPLHLCSHSHHFHMVKELPLHLLDLFFSIFPRLAFSFHIKPDPSLLLTIYVLTCKALGLDCHSQRRALEGKNGVTNCINMISVLHRGSTLSFKTMHSVNEKQGIPTPRAQSPFYFIHSEELRHEAFSTTSHKSWVWL